MIMAQQAIVSRLGNRCIVCILSQLIACTLHVQIIVYCNSTDNVNSVLPNEVLT